MTEAISASRVDMEGLERRFWPKVQKGDQCWVWTAGTKTGGYGAMRAVIDGKRKNLAAHRAAWLLVHGEIPPTNMDVCHMCDNRLCVRPDHLFLGSRSDNMRDAAKKGRIVNVGMSRITLCKHGHELTPENTYVRPNGHRVCRKCKKIVRDRAAAIRAPQETSE